MHAHRWDEVLNEYLNCKASKSAGHLAVSSSNYKAVSNFLMPIGLCHLTLLGSSNGDLRREKKQYLTK